MKLTFRSKNFTQNFCREKWFQRSNVPTNMNLKVYTIINQYFNNLYFCWNFIFLLEPVGTCWTYFFHSVGTIFSSNSPLKGSNISTGINYQLVTCKKWSLLERWNVGTKNDTL